MKIMLYLSDAVVPLVFVAIILNGYFKKVNVYESFIDGARDGFTTVLNIMPTIIGLMIAVSVLRASGTLEIISSVISPLTERVGFPSETVPLIFMRLVSSSASTGLVLDLFQRFGPDSFIGRFTSVMMSCTETVFYTMSVYFMSVKIKKTSYTLAGALFANFAAVVISFFITKLVF